MSNHDDDNTRIEGGLLARELLSRLRVLGRDVPGAAPSDYHLVEGERVNEVISRSWNRLTTAWRAFQREAERLAPDAPDAAITRERWLLVLLQELGFGRLEPSRSREISGKLYPISHFWGPVPIHLLGFRTQLDARTRGVAGAARQSPHSLIQEYLNRSEESLWGVVSNGYVLRLLRDNVSLTRQAYVEFDLQGMFEGEAYADFVILWLLAHQSRFEPRGEPARVEDCWLEQWTRLSQEQGTRVMEQLRAGVEAAIQTLGSGFLAHPANQSLLARLRSGGLDKQDYYRQLLRLVYRLLFLFVAEDRDALLHPGADSVARARYLDHYSTRQLRRLAGRRRGGPHPDLYRSLRVVMDHLGRDGGCPTLGLPPLGSLLWSREAVPDLADADVANADLLAAVRALAFTIEGKVLRSVDYRNLGAEELGSVYESLLELHPDLNLDAGTFELTTAAGHERKTTGSYYTPSSLVQCLLDSALNPVLDAAVAKPNPEQAILALKVCDPACGSGHFLIAAAHRIAARLASVRTGESDPPPGAVRTAVRDVIGHCIYGVDLNPMAVELCKVSLWMEAMEPGKPLSFLDHRLLCGNSLLGATPELIGKGIPDDAFQPIEGDDKKVVSALKKRNKQQRESPSQMHLFHDLIADAQTAYRTLGLVLTGLDVLDDSSIEGIRQKEQRYRRLADSPELRKARLVADAWCAAFVWKKQAGAIEAVTQDTLLRVQRDPSALPTAILTEVERLARRYQFLHWHIGFPDVFGSNGDRVPVATSSASTAESALGGFDMVLGNPPWERVKLQEKEWFAERSPEIANAPNAAARKRLIEALKASDPVLHQQFLDDCRKAEGESHFLRNSGRYPLCGRGDINTYAVFAESMRNLLSDSGRVGCVLPTGIATDDTTKFFFQDVVKKKSLVSLFDFENGKGLFPSVQGNIKFCLFTLSALAVEEFVIAAQLDDPELLHEASRRYRLTGKDIRAVNPNTLNCPMFRFATDALLVTSIHARHPILVNEGGGVSGNPWRVAFTAMFHMTNDSSCFKTLEELNGMGATCNGNIFHTVSDDYSPLYEAKLVHQFNHRAATFQGISVADRFKIHAGTSTPTETDLSDPSWAPLPRFWIPEQELGRRDTNSRFLSGFRNAISATADSRSLVVTVLPRVGVGNSLPLFQTELGAAATAVLTAALNAFVVDYVLRQKASGGNLNFYILKQIPVVDPNVIHRSAVWGGALSTTLDWLLLRALELTYTAWDLEPFARDCGWHGPPFRWHEERRFLLRCELDAAFVHLYLPAERDGGWHFLDSEPRAMRDSLLAAFPTPRHAIDYIMETFPIVKRRDIEKHGDYRTKLVILDIYDRMQRAIATGEPYQTVLDPPPADPRVAHPPREAGRREA